MEDAQPLPQVDDEDVILGFLPDPPPFYKHFTAENIAWLKDITKEAASENDDRNAPATASAAKLSTDQILALPSELRYLIPPEPPADDAEFHVFDTVAKAKGTDVFVKKLEFMADQLKMQGVFQDWTYEQLYPIGGDASSQQSAPTNSASLDRQNYLFRLLRSILLSYIALLGIMAADPTSEQKDQKLKDIMTMVTNMHALINEYRPHQARQTLIERMEEQVRRKREEVEGVRKMGEKVREVLGSFGGVDDEGKTENGSLAAEDAIGMEQARNMDAQKATWEALEDVMG